jgi:hypothetical protein
VSSKLNARGAGSKSKLAIPWTASQDGKVTGFATYWVHATEGSYYEGDGGIQVVTLRPDVGGVPGDTVLGELRLNRPCARGGAFAPCGGWDHAHTLNFLSLGTPGTVKAGQKYWWHIENVHSDPQNNWTGVDGLSDAKGPYNDFPQLYRNRGSGWQPASNADLGIFPRSDLNSWPDGYVDYTDSTFAAIYAVKYSDGTISSQSPYAEAKAALAEWGGKTPIFQQIEVPGGTLEEVWLHAEHLSGSNQVTLTINGATYTAGGDGWIKFTPNLAVSDGLVTLRFSSNGSWRTRAQWRYWPDAPDWGGGGHHGAVGNDWVIWGKPRAADLPFLATIRTK